jgi:hypothetical protein
VRFSSTPRWPVAVALVALLSCAGRAAAQEIVVIAGSRSAMPDCDQAVPYYGPVVVGGLVVLDRHRPWRGDSNWNAGMEAFLGQVATVTELSGLDDVGCPGVRVDLDQGEFFWRIRDMDLARVVTERGRVEETLTTTGYADRPPPVRYPYAYVDRPLVLARGILSPALWLGLFRGNGALGGDSFSGFADVSMEYGVTEYLELGADLAPISLAPDTEYGNPSLRATVRFFGGELEMGFRVEGVLPIRDGSSFLLRAAIPILGHLGGVGRIDVTPQFSFRFADPITTSFAVPLSLSFNLGDYFFLGGSSGFGFQVDRVDTSAFVPLGAFVGGTIPGESGPITDIRATFTFPAFYFAPIASQPFTDLWIVSLDARFYIYLL